MKRPDRFGELTACESPQRRLAEGEQS